MMEQEERKALLFERILSRLRRQPRGQSFIELTLVVLVLALLLSGVVEFGFMLNQYLHVLDGAREAARVASNDVPFEITNGIITGSYRPDFFYLAADRAASTMYPVTLNPANPDDIVISVFSVTSGSTPIRFPSADRNGWSLCAHFGSNPDDFAVGYAGFAAYITSQGGSPNTLFPGWGSGCTVRASQLSVADVLARVNASAPSIGVVLVEIYYNYPQLSETPGSYQCPCRSGALVCLHVHAAFRGRADCDALIKPYVKKNSRCQEEIQPHGTRPGSGGRGCLQPLSSLPSLAWPLMSVSCSSAMPACAGQSMRLPFRPPCSTVKILISGN